MPTPRPTVDQVNHYLEEWARDSDNEKHRQEVINLFNHYPQNDNYNPVFQKVKLLNARYRTRVPINLMAEHICELGIDNRLGNLNDLVLVNEIADIHVRKQTDRRRYSFATKYCHFHRSNVYPIYDSHVRKMLWCFKKQYKFANFIECQLELYPDFRRIYMEFIDYFGLEDFDIPDIDKYLWMAGG